MTLTPQGFQRRSYDDYLEEMEQTAKELFGSDINLGDASPLGQWIQLIAYQRAEENELAEAVYHSAFIDSAEGVSLDYAVKYKSMHRFSERAAEGVIKLTVEPGATVDPGFLVATTDGIQFFTVAAAKDEDADGVVYANIEAVEPGYSGNVPANTITEIITPNMAVDAVINEMPTVFGRDVETDAELRNRYYATAGESSTVDGIASKLINEVPGVRTAIVIENDTDETDADGRPPHSFEAIVSGGEPEDIGLAILQTKAGGIRAYGRQTVTVKDAAGHDQTIGFSHAAAKNIFANITITKDAAFPVDGEDRIKQLIVEYIGGTDKEGIVHAGLSMGQDVILGRITSFVFSIPGIVTASVKISTDGKNFGSDDIEIAATEVAETDVDKLVITIG